MQRILRDQARKYAFDWQDEPLLRVQPGESFVIETWDASTGYFQTPQQKAIPALRPGFDRHPPLANPIGGPVYVEGAERGDTLVITMEDILVGDFSWIAIGPRRGPLGESTRWPELSNAYTTLVFRHTPGPSGTNRDGILHFNERISWPITPFIGTLGVAPDREVATSLDGQGDWGGNLDIRDVCPGNRILVPISPSRGIVLSRRRPRQPGRHRIHRHRRRDQRDGAGETGTDQGPPCTLDADRETGVDHCTACQSAHGGGCGDGDGDADGVANRGLWHERDGGVLFGEYVSGLPD